MTKISLDQITIASPCTVSWDAMSGDTRSRHCGQCNQKVYNLSDMTEDDAQALIMKREGRLCIRFYKRADGTMMTKDCLVGWRAVRRRAVLIAGTAAAVLFAIFGLFTLGVFAASVRGNGNGGVRMVNPVQRVRDWLFPPPVCVMGEAPPVGPIPVPPPGVNPPPAPVVPELEPQK